MLIGTTLWLLLEPLYRISCHLGLPAILTVAHSFTRSETSVGPRLKSIPDGSTCLNSLIHVFVISPTVSKVLDHRVLSQKGVCRLTRAGPRSRSQATLSSLPPPSIGPGTPPKRRHGQVWEGQ